jgi:hypothetical protein
MATARKNPGIADRAAREAGERIASGITPGTTAPKPTSSSNNNKNQNQPAATTTPAAAVVPPDWERAAMELYGGYYAVVASVPELKDLLLKAAQQGYTPEQFEYELRQTQWYKTNSASAREWDMASQIDPASAQQSVQNAGEIIRNKAMAEFNVQLDDATITRLATSSLRFKWGEQLLSNAIGLEASKTAGGLSQLASGYVGQSVRQIANDYGLKLGEEAVSQWTAGIATGQQTADTFRTYAIQQAKTLFPSIGGQIDMGMTFQQIVDPYKTAASRILELNPNSIDFTDPKWATAIAFADQSGNQRMMTYPEWGDYLRNNKSFGYEYTTDARSRAYEVSNRLANLFGNV